MRARRLTIKGLFPVLSACLLSVTIASAQQDWPLWKAYTSHFYESDGRFVARDEGTYTTSEAQAYGLFFALVANDRVHFDRILTWTQSNLADGNLGKNLPAWLWGKRTDGAWGVLDQNSAADADLWLSYVLLQAGRLWHEPAYFRLGIAVSNLIASGEIAELPGFGPMVLPGKLGFRTGDASFVLNPSYLPPQVITQIASRQPGTVWTQLADRLPRLLVQSSPRGFAMDWVSYDGKEGFSTTSGLPHTPGGSYDAIRVYLWAGMMAVDAPGRAAILESLNGMQHYLEQRAFPPEKVSGHGEPTGPAGSVGFCAAVIPYLSATSSLKALANQNARLAVEQDSSELYGTPPKYYNQVLALFATGWRDGRFRFGRDGSLHVAWNSL